MPRHALTPSDAPAAIGAGEFARLLLAFDPLPAKIAVAVSGGPDSMALAFCLKRWNKSELVALIVDHALRPEAPEEARETQKRLGQLGIAADILRWEHGGVTARLHEKARAARYDLLLAGCRTHNIQTLFTAHHADDQAETILLRICKGSGIEGLAGMSPATMRDDVSVLRPFLALEKTRLIATCDAHQLAFVSDPGNGSEKFARGRLRAIMPLLEREGMTRGNLLRLGAKAAAAEQALARYARDFLREYARIETGGSIRLDRAALGAIPRATALHAVATILRAISVTPYPPDSDALSDFTDFLVAASGDNARSFHNCLASTGDAKITFLREPAAAVEIAALAPGQEILWDRRWLVSLAPGASAGEIRALGSPEHDQLDRLAPDLRRLVPQGRVRASLPALWQGDRLIAAPGFDEKAVLRLRPAKLSFA